MPQPFFTGNYGASLAQVNTAPIERAGAAMGQAFQSIGTSIASAMEKHEKKKKEKEQEEATRVMLAGAFENNKEVAAAMGYPTDAEGQDVFLKAAAKNPNTLPTMTAFLNARALNQRLTQEKELHPVAKRTAEASAEVAELNVRLQKALEDGKLELAKEIMGNKLMKAQAEKEFMELGGGSAKTLKEMEDLKVKGARLGNENIQSQINYREAMTDYYEKLPGIEQMKANAKSIENAGYGKQSEALKKDWESLLGRRIKLHSGEHVKLEDYLDPTSEFGKNRKKYPITEDALGGIYGEMEGLRLRQDDLIQKVMVTVDDSDAGEGSVFDNIDSEILGMTRPQAAEYIGNKIDDAIKEKAAIQGKLDQQTLTIAQEKEARAAIQKLDKEIDQLGSSKYHVPDLLDQYPANYGSWMY